MKRLLLGCLFSGLLLSGAIAPPMKAQERHPLQAPFMKRNIYPADADAKAEIHEALERAAKEHHRVLLVFGGNWCLDCHVLDSAFHDPAIAPTVEKYFEVVHVDIGKYDKNLDLTKQYDTPLDKGVPAMAVLDSNGKLLFSGKNGEFEKARSMSREDILAFLNRWKPNGESARLQR